MLSVRVWGIVQGEEGERVQELVFRAKVFFEPPSLYAVSF